MSAWTAESLYGVPQAFSGVTAQPATPSPTGAGSPQQAVTGRPRGLGNPTLWIIVLLGVAFGLVHMSFRLS